ncbi:AbrB/MazE/SpoVT family DNA-binding domain-containing protein [bacterium]|nr:MAG: AbrB/MazE/SpoVT family DNA-binding domain-containing protein [bacterium]
MHKTSVTRKGQTVVPAPLRKRFNIGPNSQLVWSTDGKVIEVTPLPADPIKVLRGFSEKHRLREALLRKRREDKALE